MKPPARPRLGVTIETAAGGVRVLAVSEGSVAQASGLAAGDLIIGAAGVDVLMCDSTNAFVQGSSGSEAALAPSIDVVVSRDYTDPNAPSVFVPNFTNPTAAGDPSLVSNIGYTRNFLATPNTANSGGLEFVGFLEV